ncbi:MAG: ABC transporter permease [Sterolibacterium sp.]|jgi:putative ABC transport system permease protein|nr:ABC transporter permease [Sterolibacterium sp.]
MRSADILRFARDAALGSPLRTSLLVLAISIGVAAVVTLTALGDGARRYILHEFSSMGTNLVIVMPGRTSTGGFNPANAITGTPRDLTIGDAQALLRSSAVNRVAPLAIGNTEIGFEGKLREVVVLGTTTEYIQIRSLNLAQGRFLTNEDWTRGLPEVVLGATIRNELFGPEPALGRLVRIGGRRFRVIGVFAPSGSSLGMNTDEIVMIPVAMAQSMLNSNTLFRIFIEARGRESIEAAKTQALDIITQRHEREADVTVITQDAVLHTFDRLLTALTLGLAGISAISLVVSGILVMNVMLVSVVQRTSEIGLLKALGATRRNIELAFLTEAGILSLAGAVVGYGLGLLGAAVIRQMYPTFPAYPPDWAVLAGLGTALVSGILFGVAPARNAASLDPVVALSKH